MVEMGKAFWLFSHGLYSLGSGRVQRWILANTTRNHQVNEKDSRIAVLIKINVRYST
jgi:hypothetical protein